MPEVIFSGPAGRIEGRYTKAKEPGAPIALLLHPHPQFGGTMNNPIVHSLYYMFAERGFSVLRFNFRGVGRSQGLFENGAGELSDAASALDWLQSFNRETRICWLGRGVLRRLDLDAAPDAAAGGDRLHLGRAAGQALRFLVPRPLPRFRPVRPWREGHRHAARSRSTAWCRSSRPSSGIKIDHKVIPGANHFFQDKTDELVEICSTYLDRRMSGDS